jgi:hypothetical protein
MLLSKPQSFKSLNYYTVLENVLCTASNNLALRKCFVKRDGCTAPQVYIQGSEEGSLALQLALHRLRKQARLLSWALVTIPRMAFGDGARKRDEVFKQADIVLESINKTFNLSNSPLGSFPLGSKPQQANSFQSLINSLLRQRFQRTT